MSAEEPAPMLSHAGHAPALPEAVYGRVASPLFRQRALEAHERGDELAPLLHVAATSGWVLVGSLGSAVVAAVVICALCKLDVTSTGRGVLRAKRGTYELSAHVTGRVSSVLANVGSDVKAGQVILSIEQSNAAEELQEVESRLRLANTQLAEANGPLRQRRRDTLNLLDQQAVLIARRHEVEQATLRALRARLETYQRLGDDGVVSRAVLEGIEEDIRLVQRRELSVQEEATQTGIAVSSVKREYDAELARRSAHQVEVQARRDALASLLKKSVVVAPNDGRLDALLVRPGEMAQLGVVLGRIVSVQGPSTITAFIDEKDRAFLKPASRVRASIDQLPVAEFGKLKGRVVRIAEDLSSLADAKDVLGDTVTAPGPSYRVEIALDGPPPNARMRRLMRSGTLVSVQFHLRQRRILALAFDPLRRWLEER